MLSYTQEMSSKRPSTPSPKRTSPKKETVDERRARYTREGAVIRAKRERPYYIDLPSDGLTHENLGLLHDPIYYLAEPINQYVLDDPRLNLCAGIVANASNKEFGGAIPWYSIDWECVPDSDESIREAYLADRRQDGPTVDLLLANAYSGSPAASLYMQYLALVYQPKSTYVLPDLRITFQGDAASSVPMFRVMLQKVCEYIMENDVPLVANDVYEYFGLKAYTENKKPYLRHNNIVSLPDLIENEVLICKERNPDDPLGEIGRTMDKRVLLMYASAGIHLKGKVEDELIEQCSSAYDLVDLEENLSGVNP